MLTIGVDAHKALHVAVALDEAGREIGHWRGPNREASWDELLTWAKKLSAERRWGIEGAWNFGRGLAQRLIGAGEAVYEVNPRWTAAGRRRARARGKSDRLDARAVAASVRQEGESLPVVPAEDACSVLDLLATEREELVAEATRLRNQLHQLLLQLDPAYAQRFRDLKDGATLQALEAYEEASAAPVQQARAAAVRRLARRLRLAGEQAEDLAAEIRRRAAARCAPLTRLCGVSLLTAGALAGILGPGRRFASDAQLAAYAGVAPLEASSAGKTRHRLNRGGNRRLNAILYRIALTQARCSDQAKAYLARRVAEGKTLAEAFRALKRHLIRAIFRLWRECLEGVVAETA